MDYAVFRPKCVLGLKKCVKEKADAGVFWSLDTVQKSWPGFVSQRYVDALWAIAKWLLIASGLIDLFMLLMKRVKIVDIY